MEKALYKYVYMLVKRVQTYNRGKPIKKVLNTEDFNFGD